MFEVRVLMVAERLHGRGLVSGGVVEWARRRLVRHLRHFDIDA